MHTAECFIPTRLVKHPDLTGLTHLRLPTQLPLQTTTSCHQQYLAHEHTCILQQAMYPALPVHSIDALWTTVDRALPTRLDCPLDHHCFNCLLLEPLPYPIQSSYDLPNYTQNRVKNYNTKATIKPADSISIPKSCLQSYSVQCPHYSDSPTQSMHLMALALSVPHAIAKHDLKPP